MQTTLFLFFCEFCIEKLANIQLYPLACDGQHNVIEQLTHSEYGRTQQQTHEAAHLTEQTEEGEALLLPDPLVTQVLVEHVHLQEIISSDRGFDSHSRHTKQLLSKDENGTDEKLIRHSLQ